MNKTRTSRPGKLQERLLSNIWLVVPVGVIVAVVVLAIVNQKPKTTDTPQVTTSGSPSTSRSTAPEFEAFAVTTAGSPLPARPANAKLPATSFPNLGQKHVPDNQKVKYNSNPPTSGSHYDTPAKWGIYSQKSPVDEQLVHNLEHGGIIISYNPQTVKGDELEKIRVQARELSKINPRLIVVPRANLDRPIALTAWGYLQKLEKYDQAAIKAFYDAHVARAPECQGGLCPP